MVDIISLEKIMKKLVMGSVALVVFAFVVANLINGAPVMAEAASAGSGVMGIDLGSEFIKVGGVKSGTIDIVLNEQSHRKSHHWLGFRGDDRFFAEDAKNFAARFPTQMAGAFNRMVGLPFEETAWLAEELHLHFNISQRKVATAEAPLAEDGVPIVEANFGAGGVKNKNNTYQVQEALGMVFHHLRGMAERDLEQTTRDAVVVVPSFFNARQSQAVIDAAAIGGVKVITLLQSNTATGLMYGIQRRGFGKETHIIIYDMGATKTEVSLLQYSAVHPDEAATGTKNKVKLAHRMGTMKVVKHVADAALGGRLFDVCMAKGIEQSFVNKNPKLVGPMAESKKILASGKQLTPAIMKSLISLFRAANKAKEVLGSNKMASVTVEGIVPDRDFSTQVTRERFEQDCESLFKRSANVLQKLLDETGIDRSEVEALEMMGGGARIPKILDDIGAVFGRPVSRTINGDEAAAIGATYFAATLTESVRVKSFAVKDVFARNISFTLSPKPGQSTTEDGTAVAQSNTRPLFIGSAAPSKKTVTVARDQDFDMTIFATDNSGKRQDDFTVTFNGLESALDNSGYYVEGLLLDKKELVHPNNTHSIQVSLRASEANVVTVEKAILTIKYATNVTMKVKVTDEELQAGSGAEKESADTESTSQEGEEDSKKEESSGDSKEDKASKKKEDSTTKYKNVKTVVMKKKYVNLKVDISYSEPKPFSSDAIASSRSLLKKLEAIDTEKRDLAASRNDLEAYILFIRGEGFFENQNVLDKVDSVQQAEVKASLDSVAAWFDDSADVTLKGTFLTKLHDIRTAVQKVLPEELKKKVDVKKSSGSSEKKKSKKKASSADDEDDSPKKKKKSSGKKSSSSGGTKRKADTSSKKSKGGGEKKSKKTAERDTTGEL